MALTVYGIPNCDTVKKARAWLDERGTAYAFHDLRKAGVPADRLADWSRALGWEALLNRRGTTWRQLPPADQAAVLDAPSAMRLMQAHSSVIKRPVVEWPGRVSVGFDPKSWALWAAGD